MSLGFFGRVGLRAGFGGGATGSSCATTGLGSIRVVPTARKPAGLPLTRTGTVTGLKSFRVKLTEKSVSGTGTLTEQGVLQPDPIEVRASAPGGVDSRSICMVGCRGGADAQAARLNPATANAMT